MAPSEHLHVSPHIDRFQVLTLAIETTCSLTCLRPVLNVCDGLGFSFGRKIKSIHEFLKDWLIGAL